MLHVEPPLRPEGGALYVHTFPRLLEDMTFDVLPLLAFCRSVSDDYEAIVQAKYAKDDRSPGGSEPVKDKWDSWSGRSQREHRNKPRGYVLEYLESQSFDPSAVEPPSIDQDLLLYNQLVADYSWMGFTDAVSWALKLREPPSLDSSFVGNLPTFEGLKAHALTPWSMKIPFDGDSPVVENSSQTEALGWDDEHYVELELVPRYVPPVPALSTRVIACDLFGTILDRDGAVNDAMRLLSPAYPDRHRLLEPALYDDAEVVVKTLLNQGYTVVGLPIPDAKSFWRPRLPSGLTLDQVAPLSDLFGQNPSMFSNLLNQWGTVEKNQILVVTSSPYQVMKPASIAGLPMVLV
ncbi:hypothetical protein DFH29DRAFT_871545 [Suillus ampliporus]|nr:hypothetical protein DFH29DRAFT_871545 [Suillus ampliporus]